MVKTIFYIMLTLVFVLSACTKVPVKSKYRNEMSSEEIDMYFKGYVQ